MKRVALRITAVVIIVLALLFLAPGKRYYRIIDPSKPGALTPPYCAMPFDGRYERCLGFSVSNTCQATVGCFAECAETCFGLVDSTLEGVWSKKVHFWIK